MNLGLTDKDLAYIIDQLKKFSEIDRATIFGSRAKGNFKKGSDIDMAIYGGSITFNTVSKLHELLEDVGPMPYFIDVIDYTHLQHEELKNHIDRVGVAIYNK